MSVSVVLSHARAHAHSDDALWQILFSGFFINSDGIPVFFDWIKYLSPMKYSYGAFMQNEYEVTLIIKAYSTRVICCEDVSCVRLRARACSCTCMCACGVCARACVFVSFMPNEYQGLVLTCEAKEKVARSTCPPEKDEAGAVIIDPVTRAPKPSACFCPVTDGQQVCLCLCLYLRLRLRPDRQKKRYTHGDALTHILIQTYTQVLGRMSLTPKDSGLNVIQNLGILIGLWVGLACLAYCLLERRATRRERQRSRLLSL